MKSTKVELLVLLLGTCTFHIFVQGQLVNQIFHNVIPNKVSLYDLERSAFEFLGIGGGGDSGVSNLKLI
jgi:hypothetical protein